MLQFKNVALKISTRLISENVISYFDARFNNCKHIMFIVYQPDDVVVPTRRRRINKSSVHNLV